MESLQAVQNIKKIQDFEIEEEKFKELQDSSQNQLEIVQKIIDQPLDFTSTTIVESNNNAMDQMIKLQNQQYEQMQAMMDKNNDYFPNDEEVELMKQKQAEQAEQINMLLEKLNKQKSDPKMQTDPEVSNKIAAFEEQLNKAKMQSDKLNAEINSKRFEEVQVAKLDNVESIKKLSITELKELVISEHLEKNFDQKDIKPLYKKQKTQQPPIGKMLGKKKMEAI